MFITNIHQECQNNNSFRKILFTSSFQQIVVMSVDPMCDIEFEIHPDNDQFINIDSGSGVLFIGENKEQVYKLSKGSAFIVPKNTYHQIFNFSQDEKLKLFTIYSPPHHNVQHHNV